MIENIRIGYDANLGIANDFSAVFPCTLSEYKDLTQLIEHYTNKLLDAAFLPVGALPYINDYKIISQAIFGPENLSVLTANFISTKNINLNDLPKFTLGRINHYCTTSYWGPLIYFMKFLPPHTELKFQDTENFHDLLVKTANGIIDGAALWEIILTKNPTAASRVKNNFSLTNLPAPILIARENWGIETISKLNEFTSDDKQSFFTAFRHPNILMINEFLTEIDRACDFYHIDVSLS